MNGWLRRVLSFAPRQVPHPIVPEVSNAIELVRHNRKLAENLRILAEVQGQAKSIQTGRPVNGDGLPIPWYTYPAIEYLERWDLNGKYIFEFGCGSSTLYWLRRGAVVVAVENDPDWYEILRVEQPGTDIRLRQDRASYVGAIAESNERYDIIIIDGRWRAGCVRSCQSRLRSGGFVILDNSDWYFRTAQALSSAGFLEVSFSGFGPINDYTWTTSFFFPLAGVQKTDLLPSRPLGGLKVDGDSEDGM